jgi:hypothetical protein
MNLSKPDFRMPDHRGRASVVVRWFLGGLASQVMVTWSRPWPARPGTWNVLATAIGKSYHGVHTLPRHSRLDCLASNRMVGVSAGCVQSHCRKRRCSFQPHRWHCGARKPFSLGQRLWCAGFSFVNSIRRRDLCRHGQRLLHRWVGRRTGYSQGMARTSRSVCDANLGAWSRVRRIVNTQSGLPRGCLRSLGFGGTSPWGCSFGTRLNGDPSGGWLTGTGAVGAWCYERHRSEPGVAPERRSCLHIARRHER